MIFNSAWDLFPIIVISALIGGCVKTLYDDYKQPCNVCGKRFCLAKS